MASCKVATTKCAYAAITYALRDKTDKHSERPLMKVAGVDCSVENAVKFFKADRVLWRKNSGLEAHIVYQSFKGNEVSIEDANTIGVEMAEQLCPGHKAIVVTHGDTNNIHNHIIINAVSFETGKKINTSGFLNRSRSFNEKLCAEHGLSDIREVVAVKRLSRTERELEAKGVKTWKSEIREAIEASFSSSDNYEEFVTTLRNDYRVDIDEVRGTFKSMDNDKHRVRGKKLGDVYTLEHIKKSFAERTDERLDELDQAYIWVYDNWDELSDDNAVRALWEIERMSLSLIRDGIVPYEKRLNELKTAIQKRFDYDGGYGR